MICTLALIIVEQEPDRDWVLVKKWIQQAAHDVEYKDLMEERVIVAAMCCDLHVRCLINYNDEYVHCIFLPGICMIMRYWPR